MSTVLEHQSEGLVHRHLCRSQWWNAGGFWRLANQPPTAHCSGTPPTTLPHTHCQQYEQRTPQIFTRYFILTHHWSPEQKRKSREQRAESEKKVGGEEERAESKGKQRERPHCFCVLSHLALERLSLAFSPLPTTCVHSAQPISTISKLTIRTISIWRGKQTESQRIRVRCHEGGTQELESASESLYKDTRCRQG